MVHHIICNSDIIYFLASHAQITFYRTNFSFLSLTNDGDLLSQWLCEFVPKLVTHVSQMVPNISQEGLLDSRSVAVYQHLRKL